MKMGGGGGLKKGIMGNCLLKNGGGGGGGGLLKNNPEGLGPKLLAAINGAAAAMANHGYCVMTLRIVSPIPKAFVVVVCESDCPRRDRTSSKQISRLIFCK